MKPVTTEPAESASWAPAVGNGGTEGSRASDASRRRRAPPSEHDPLLLVLTPAFFQHEQLMKQTLEMLKERKPSDFVPMYSTVLPFDEYIGLCNSSPEAQELKKHGLLNLMFEKWPTAAELQLVAAQDAVLKHMPEPSVIEHQDIDSTMRRMRPSIVNVNDADLTRASTGLARERRVTTQL